MYKGSLVQQTVYIVKGLHTNLLGLPAIQALQILKRLDTVNSIETEQVNVQKQYPTVFKGLGVLGDEYKIN